MTQLTDDELGALLERDVHRARAPGRPRPGARPGHRAAAGAAEPAWSRAARDRGLGRARRRRYDVPGLAGRRQPTDRRAEPDDQRDAHRDAVPSSPRSPGADAGRRPSA